MNDRPANQKSDDEILNGYQRIDYAISHEDPSWEGYERYSKIDKQFQELQNIIFKMILRVVDKFSGGGSESTHGSHDEAELLLLELKSCVPSKRKETFLAALAREELIIEINRQLREFEFIQAESQRLAEKTEEFLDKLKEENSWWKSTKGGPPIEEEKKVEVEKLLEDLSHALNTRKTLVQQAIKLQENITTKRNELYQVQMDRAQTSVTYMREGAEIGLRELQRVLDIPENQPGHLSGEARVRVAESLEEGRAAQKRMDNIDAVLAKEKIDLKQCEPLQKTNKLAVLGELQHLKVKGDTKKFGNVKVYEEHEKSSTAEKLRKIVNDEKDKRQDIKKTLADFKKTCDQIKQQDQHVQSILKTIQSYDIPEISASIPKLQRELQSIAKMGDERSPDKNEDSAKKLDAEKQDDTTLTSKADNDKQPIKSSESTTNQEKTSNTDSDIQPSSTPRFGGEE